MFHFAKKINRSKCYKIRNNYISLQYISDIHLEYRNTIPIIPQNSDNLALLGDIGNPFKKNYTEFIDYTSNNWNKVFLITGNHEYWQEKYNMDDVNDKINDIVSKFSNVIFLNNESHYFNNYKILGTTLWSNVYSKPETQIGDDLYIKYKHRTITHDDINKLHSASVKWLEKNIAHSNHSADIPIIILSHHLPSYKLIIEKFHYGKYAKYHDRFASHLDHLIKYPVKFWLCGHSHCNFNLTINDTYCGINAYGYPYESIKKFAESIVISLD